LLRQSAHFIGDHFKGAAGFSGPRRLNGGVQRQDFGLLGYLPN